MLDTHNKDAFLAIRDNRLLDFLELLSQKEFDPNIKANTDFGQDLLSFAISYGRESMIEPLIEKGANLNAKDKIHGMTSLHRAAFKEDAVTVNTLIMHGADLAIRNNYNKNFVSLLTEQTISEMEIVNKPIFDLLDRHNFKEMDKRIEKNPSIFNVCDKSFNNLLIHSVAKNDVLTVEYLMVRGANPYTKNPDGKTAFDVASEMGNTKVMQKMTSFEKNKDNSKYVEGLNSKIEKLSQTINNQPSNKEQSYALSAFTKLKNNLLHRTQSTSDLLAVVKDNEFNVIKSKIKNAMNDNSDPVPTKNQDKMQGKDISR